MAKINPKIVENLKEAEEWESNSEIGSLDEIIWRKCTGKKLENLNDKKYQNLIFWMLSKYENKGIIYNVSDNAKTGNVDHFKILWDKWVDILKQDFYKEFIRKYKEKYGMKELDKENRHISISGDSYYEMLLELYTGYLKYGSVDNYRKNCLENKMLI